MRVTKEFVAIAIAAICSTFFLFVQVAEGIANGFTSVQNMTSRDLLLVLLGPISLLVGSLLGHWKERLVGKWLLFCGCAITVLFVAERIRQPIALVALEFIFAVPVLFVAFLFLSDDYDRHHYDNRQQLHR